MDQLLRPARITASGPNSSHEWSHWRKTFENFVSCIKSAGDSDKLMLLTNLLSPDTYEQISECQTYEEAICTLDKIHVPASNEIYARHILYTRRQSPVESVDDYLLALKTLSKQCNFRAVSGESYRNEYLRDVFITGLASSCIRQRLLENPELDLNTAMTQARSLESAQKIAEQFSNDINKITGSINTAGHTSDHVLPVETVNVNSIA